MSNQPLSLHPENPHYFLFRGKPAILLTAGEHYGAVVNLDFDYVSYLDELCRMGFNLTRLFPGTYVEYKEFANIEGNSLAPEPGRFICPWEISSSPGAWDGGYKYDLDRWNPAYFDRLRDFCQQASDRGIVIEISLFSPFYDDKVWQICPYNAVNNINGVGHISREQAYTMGHPDTLACQESVVANIVAELNDFDNIYYEICNEPYWGAVEDAWQERITECIVRTEKELGNRHLIGINVLNGFEVIEKPWKSVSIYNFHYSDDKAILANYHLNKPIGCNETGVRAWNDDFYRKEAWLNILAGGGIYNHLDMTFSVGHEKGTLSYSKVQPAGGSAQLRGQLKILKDFIHDFDFIRMKPAGTVVKKFFGVNDFRWVALGEPGETYAIYFVVDIMNGVGLDVPPNRYKAEWVNPGNGIIEKEQIIEHDRGLLNLSHHVLNHDIALRITRI